MKNIRQNIMAITAAFLWGMAFSCQSICASRGMGVFQFNFTRALIACVPLFFLAVFFAGGFKKLTERLKDKKYLFTLLFGGFVSGIAMFLSHTFQQAALGDSSCGKVGFITALYVVIVPILGMFFKQKASFNVWLSVFFAVVGMVFLCIEPGTNLGLSVSDLLAFLCALSCAVHILLISHFVEKVDAIQLSFTQTLVAGLVGMACSFIFETPTIAVTIDCIWYILYMGIMSSGVAYTLQILAQKDSNPTVISLLMSMEAVFSVIAGAVVLKEQLTMREYIGCGIMFVAIIFAQLPASMFDIMHKKERN